MPAYQTTPHMIARSTSGARLAIRYDERTNSLIYVENGFSEDGRDAASPRAMFREQLRTADVIRLNRRRLR